MGKVKFLTTLHTFKTTVAITNLFIRNWFDFHKFFWRNIALASFFGASDENGSGSKKRFKKIHTHWSLHFCFNRLKDCHNLASRCGQTTQGWIQICS